MARAAKRSHGVSRPPAIRARDLGKTYRVYARPADRLFEVLTGRARHRAHRALDPVSIDVAPGEAIGIVGENGAGKSTLLRLLAGVSTPTSGTSVVQGRVASILDLSWGFHPEMTGRQNLEISAAILGLSPEDLRQCRDAIIEFSELQSVIDDPVRTYSTGMAMRLAFAIAVAIEPDILIVDEALAVGDGHFQRKCLQRIRDFLSRGGTLVLASHAMYVIAELCERALWLKDGRVESIGPAAEVIRQYESYLLAKHPAAGVDEVRPSPVRITNVQHSTSPLAHGDPLCIAIDCDTDDAGLPLHVAVGIDREDGVQICACSTKHDGLPPLSGRTHHTITLRLPRLPMLQGTFTVYVSVLDEAALHTYDRRVLPSVLDVRSQTYRIGLIEAGHQWQVDQNRSLSPHE
jgi:lipopolysaccharide transport system ATP-binding protein